MEIPIDEVKAPRGQSFFFTGHNGDPASVWFAPLHAQLVCVSSLQEIHRDGGCAQIFAIDAHGGALRRREERDGRPAWYELGLQYFDATTLHAHLGGEFLIALGSNPHLVLARWELYRIERRHPGLLAVDPYNGAIHRRFDGETTRELLQGEAEDLTALTRHRDSSLQFSITFFLRYEGIAPGAHEMPAAQLESIKTALEEDSLRWRLNPNLDGSCGEDEPAESDEKHDGGPKREHRGTRGAPRATSGGDGSGLEGDGFDRDRGKLGMALCRWRHGNHLRRVRFVLYAVCFQPQSGERPIMFDDDSGVTPGGTDDENVTGAEPLRCRHAGAVTDQPRAGLCGLREELSFRETEVAHGLGSVNAWKLHVRIRPAQRQGERTSSDDAAASNILDVDR